MMPKIFSTLLFLVCLLAGTALGTEPGAADGVLAEDIETLKQQSLELNRELFILEEELLYPADTRLSVYVSVDVGEFFQLDAVKLTLDDKVVTHYLYTERQLDALQRGGVHRLYTGNIRSGEHELVAVFTGVGPHGRDYRRGTQLRFEKHDGSRNIELKIVDSEATRQPEFLVKEW